MCVLRKCRICDIEASTEEELILFKVSHSSKYNRDNICKLCHNTCHSTYKKEFSTYKDYMKKYKILNRYGISLEEYLVAMSSSNSCEICGETSTLCYDHNHDTLSFRGVLCRKCNIAIGGFEKNPESLLQAHKYLTERGTYATSKKRKH